MYYAKLEGLTSIEKEKMDNKHIYLVAGRSHPVLKDELIQILHQVHHLSARDVPVEFRDFPSGEVYCRPLESLRGKYIYVFQTANQGQIHENLMELFVLLNAVKLASPEKVNLIVPYLPYSRQERKDVPRAPISAAMIAEILTKVCNINTLITFDLHQFAIEGFYATTNVPVAHLTTHSLFYQHFNQKFSSGELSREEVFFASPDFGGLKLTRRLAKNFNMEDQVCAINKVRHPDGQVENRVFGEVSRPTAIIFDDIIDKGTSIIAAVNALKAAGARKFYVAAVHGLFSENALRNLTAIDEIKEIVITNTIHHPPLPEKINVLSIAPLLAEVIKRIHLKESLQDYEIITL